MKNINTGVGKRVIKILNTNPKIVSSIKKLEKEFEEMVLMLLLLNYYKQKI